MRIRAATAVDDAAIAAILLPVFQAGETNAIERDVDAVGALAYWCDPLHTVFVAEDADGVLLGTSYLRANQRGGGSHVANAGYVTAEAARGRGVARAMAEHSFDAARAGGFTAMQFNIVVSTNTRAVALWQALGFAIVGRVPGAFRHPTLGAVDTLVMHRTL
ncbi:GNAT family N-acetyltransferase [Sphingomonas adhaesiva]|uniref:GNAT family N-acetyltransferase n=1 Tax=Sphingomonas adhaesiva TaxID=28212 RepID=UPI002FFD275F